MYRIAALAMDAPVVAVPLRDQRHDLEAMAAACGQDTALVYIGNPNNPTGTDVGREGFAAYFRRVPDHVLTVVDEAYFDYVEVADLPGLPGRAEGRQKRPGAPDLLEDPRASRPAAGVRSHLGRGGGRPGIGALAVQHLDPGAGGALAALGDTGHVARSRRENSRCAALLASELAKRPVEFVPTVTNFFLIRTALGWRRSLTRGCCARG